MPKKQIVIIFIAVLVGVAAVWYWYANRAKFPYPSAQPPAVSAPGVAAVAPSLGEQIYDKSQNPIQDKVPTVNPVTNPIENAYKNPFQ